MKKRNLAVNFGTRGELFLDEIINNLDQDSVGKVADMLSNFVKQRDVKLYTITHSQQIQEMDIGDDILVVG